MILNKKLTKLHNDPSFPGSLSGLNAFYKAAKTQIPTLKRREINEWAKSNTTYGDFRTVKKKFVHPPIKAGRADYCWEIDLMEVGNKDTFHPHSNKGTRYLFCCVDQFDRFAWVRPLTNKTGPSSVLAFQSILNSTMRRPKLLRADRGSEFINKSFKALARENKTHLIYSNDDPKCAIVERYNRTLKTKIVRLLEARSHNRDYNYLNALPDMVYSLNHTYHRIIGMAPADVNVNNYDIVKQNLEKYWRRQEQKVPMNRKRVRATHDVQDTRFTRGENVRIALRNMVFRRGFQKQWSDEIFEVEKVNQSYTPFAYILKDLGGERLEGKFFADQLQAVYLPNIVKIEKTLKTSKSEGVYWSLVKTAIYHKPIWIPKLEIQRTAHKRSGSKKVIAFTNFIKRKNFLDSLKEEIDVHDRSNRQTDDQAAGKDLRNSDAVNVNENRNE